MSVGSVWLNLTRRWALWIVLLEIALMLSSTLRRSLLSLLAVSTVGTLGFSAAATLSVESDDLGAGDSVVAACAPGGLTVEYGSTFLADSAGTGSANGGRFFVDEVRLAEEVADELGDCLAQDIDIAFIETGGTVIYTATGTVGAATAGEVSIAIPATDPALHVPAEDVVHIAVVISGTPAA